MSLEVHSFVVEQSHQISVFLKELYGLIFLEEIGSYFTQNGAEFKAMARAGWDNEDILVLIGPVNQKIIGFGWCVVAFFHFLYFLVLPFEKLVD